MLSNWFRGLAVGGGTALLLAALNALSPARDASSEEAMIFNAEYASSFGEDPAPRRKLQLQMLGRDEVGDFAQLNIDGELRRLRAGEAILSCVTLAGIFVDEVLIDNCGNYAVLAAKSSGGDGALVLQNAQQASLGLPVPSIVDLRDNLEVRKLAADYRRRLYERPLSLRGVVDVEVRVDSVGERRYYLSPGKDPALFSTLPLRAGDQLVAVNGLTLASREALTDIYGVLGDLNQLALTIERGEQRVVLLLRF